MFIDQKNTGRNIIYVDQPGLILAQDVYLNEGDFADYVDAYKTFIVDAVTEIATEVSGLTLDQAAVEAAADAVFELEKALAEIIVPGDQRRDLEEMYNPTTLGDLKSSYDYVSSGF